MPYFFSICLVCMILKLRIAPTDSCSDGEFLDEGKECKRCPEHCLFCDSDEYCLSCENEFWGAKCEKKCYNCKSGTTCEKTNGFCLDGCSNGLSGVLCDAQCAEKCLSCNRTNSKHCLTCAHNRFTSSCDKICPSSCSNGTCEDNTGFCTFGCKVGFWGTKCERECPVHCVNKVCVRENGTCINGSLEEGAVPSYIFYVPAIVILIGLIVAILGAGIWRTRQKRRAQNSSRLTQTESENLLTESSDKKIDTGSEDASSKQLKNLNSRDQNEKTTLDFELIEVSELNSSTTEPVVGQTEADRKKTKQPNKDQQYVGKKLSKPMEIVQSIVGKVKTSEADRGESKCRQQKFKDIAKQLETKNKADIRKEFYDLPSVNSEKLCIESQQTRNKKKLEEAGICPYDFNRVAVTGHTGKHFYMNASYIKENRNKDVAFIACIAPSYEYFGWSLLFWRMVWLERCSVIVMLNTLEENDTKLPQYWPRKTEKYGTLSVTCTGKYVNHKIGYVLRGFQIEGETTGPVTVKQLQYFDWSEGRAAKKVASLVKFRNIVNQAKQTNSGPIVVHSRKGTGRTGTFIALDILLQTVDDMDDSVDETAVDIYSCVKHLREQRVNMVQTVEQYKFLYEALAYYLNDKAENEPDSNADKVPK